MATYARPSVALLTVAFALIVSGCQNTDGVDTTATTTQAVPSSTTEAPDTTVSTVESSTTSTTVAPVVIGDPVHGGVVRIGLDAAVAETIGTHDGASTGPSLNPFVMVPEAVEVARLVVPGAYRLDAETGEITPWLVERIPSLGDGVEIADDGTVTVTYAVVEEAVWEDGTPVTGEDFAFTHDLIMQHAETLNRGFSAERHSLIETGSIVVDGKSITFDLTEPDVGFDRLFEWVLPAHIIDPETFVDDWNDKLWPSAGPFRFVSFDRPSAYSTEPSVITLERNPSYWETDPATGEQLPYLDGIEVYAFPGGTETGDAATRMRSGDLDAVAGRLAASWELPFYGDLDEAGVELVTEWDTLHEVLSFNLDGGNLEVNPNSHNDIADYRKAVLAAIDRDGLADLDGMEPVDSIIGIVADRYAHDAWAQHSDPEQVGELLAAVPEPYEAVYTSSHADETIAIGTWVAEQLTDAGIETTTQFVGDFWGTQFPARQFDMFALRLFASAGGLSGAAESLTAYLPGEGIVDWTGLDDEADRFADLVAQAHAEFDPDRLAEVIVEAETILADNALIYPLARRQTNNAVYRPERIQGLIPNRYQGWNTWNAAMWWSPGS